MSDEPRTVTDYFLEGLRGYVSVALGGIIAAATDPLKERIEAQDAEIAALTRAVEQLRHLQGDQ